MEHPEIAYYMGLFKIKEVKVIARERYVYMSGCSPSFFYKYLISLKPTFLGKEKLKIVHEDKLIFLQDKKE